MKERRKPLQGPSDDATPSVPSPTPADGPDSAPSALRVVGIGASAGDPEALYNFFEHLAPTTGAAFVVVQHHAPDTENQPSDQLAEHTLMPIVHVNEPIELQPDHVYLVTPATEATVTGSRLIPRRNVLQSRFPHPIDALLSSLAAAVGDRAVAVILSGNGVDGAEGVSRIRAAGGVVFVEDPLTARSAAMPRAAIRTGFVDFVLVASAIGARLEHLLAQPVEARDHTQLSAANTVHLAKIRELRELADDLEQLLLSTDVGSVFLDRALHVRRFTPAAQRVICLLEQDIGRPVHHLHHYLRDVDLVALASRVANSGEEIRTRARTDDGRCFQLRIFPFHSAHESNGGGIVLTFSDVTDLEAVRQELEASHERFACLMANLRQAVFLRDVPSLEFAYMSPYFDALWGLSAKEILADRNCWRQRVHPDDVERLDDYLERVHESAESIDYRVVHPDGSEYWLNTEILPVRDGAGTIVQEVGYTHEVTQRKRIEVALEVSVARARLFVEALPDHLLWMDESGRWSSFRDVIDPLQIEGDGHPSRPTFVDSLPTDVRRSLLEAAEAARTSGHLQTIAIDLSPGDARSRAYEARLLSVLGRGTVCMVRDISDLRASERELVELTRTLEQQANHDHLTNLPNRRGLEKVLFIELERCRRLGARMAAVLIDCDNFKRINDSMGHATGDVVLQEIGKRLRDVVRPSDSIGRVGGDEFLVLLPDTRVAEALQLAERLRLSVTDTPLKTSELVIGVTASLGVASVPPDVVSIEEVISYTQHALAHSKRAGKNRVSLGRHQTSGDQSRFDRVLESLQTGEGFRVVAQPILEMSTRTVIGYELLTRGPSGLLESPEDLFRLSAENNILTSVDLHCVKRSVAWARQRLNSVRFHINLFPSTLLDTPAARLLAVFGDPDLLSHFCVEISEQQFIGDPLYLQPHVQELRREGAHIAIDDVGFGRSSLEALIMLEPDCVKLDKSVVIGIARDRSKRHVLQRLLKVIEGIDAQAIAEGVETEADRECLLDLGLSFGQGFLFGKPSPEMLGKN